MRATAQVRERISRTLVGAAVDRDACRLLLHGRLTEEHQAPAFEALSGLRIADGSVRPDPRPALLLRGESVATSDTPG